MTDKDKITKTAKELGEKAKTKASEASDAVRGAVKDENGQWSTGAKVGAAIGSAAVAAALIYAGRHRMKKAEDLDAAKSKADIRYENEPDLDDDDLTADYDGEGKE
jgi:hypothetical protein